MNYSEDYDYSEELDAFTSIIKKNGMDNETTSIEESYPDHSIKLTVQIPKDLLWDQMMRNARDEFESEVNFPEIKKVIFNGPATIVFWSDATKTVVKCQEDDAYSKMTGLALSIAKKAMGNNSKYYDTFKKWC